MFPPLHPERGCRYALRGFFSGLKSENIYNELRPQARIEAPKRTLDNLTI